MNLRTPIFRRFVASRSAVSGIEFAMILPILLMLLLGFYDAGTAIAIYTKTRFATSTLAQITNQYATIHDSDMSLILAATSTVLAPYPSTPVVSSVSQITISSTGVATVSWSTSLMAGSSFALPAALAIPSSYLIYAQVSYTFTPSFSYFVSGPITLSDSLYVSPRNSPSITRASP
jgi:Flp pilus assembly protein TadG